MAPYLISTISFFLLTTQKERVRYYCYMSEFRAEIWLWHFYQEGHTFILVYFMFNFQFIFFKNISWLFVSELVAEMTSFLPGMLWYWSCMSNSRIMQELLGGYIVLFHTAVFSHLVAITNTMMVSLVTVSICFCLLDSDIW